MTGIEVAVRAGALNGECPVWSARERVLYWADIRAGRLHRFDPARAEDEAFEMPAWLGCFALRDHGALVALRTGLFRFRFATGALEFVAPAPYDPRRFAFNDGKCDRRGRFFAGAMYTPLAPGESSGETDKRRPLWRYDEEGGWIPAASPVQTSNGLAWSPDGRVMYHSDTERKTVFAYDYDEETGTASGRRVFAEVETRGDGGPDGACVDRDGFYICAVFGEGCLLRFDPDGRVERRIDMPARHVTMPAFGGEDLSTLYVTSANWPIPPDERSKHPNEGALFALEAPIPGIAGTIGSR